MLQRSQTVYLLLAAGLLVLLFALGHVWTPSVESVSPVLGKLIYGLTAAAATVALGAVFLYKDRKRQRTVIGYAQWIALAVLVPLLVGLFAASPDSSASTAGSVDAIGLYGRYLVALIPLVAYGLLRMARGGVDRDIATVRSMDRLR